jgi:hypothetical protein
MDRVEVGNFVDTMVEEGVLHIKQYDDGRESIFITENILSGNDLAEKFSDLELNEPSVCSTLRSSVSERENIVVAGNENDTDEKQHLKFLTNLVFEQQRAYNELFDNYKEERLRNITITQENRDLYCELAELRPLKLQPQNKHTQSTASQTETIISHPEAAISKTDSAMAIQDNQNNDTNNNNEHLMNDLASIRKQKHDEFIRLTKKTPSTVSISTTPTPTFETPKKSPKCINVDTPSIPLFKQQKPERNKAHEWRNDVILVTGDSMIGGLESNKMRAAGEVKVRPHPGGNVRDMYDHLEPHLSKKPSTLVLHIGTNNTADQTSNEILEEILQLDKWIETKTEGRMKRFYSMPIIRYDDAKATLTTRHLQAKLRNSELKIIDNSNIEKDHLGKKLHHLNHTGTKLLAANMINFLKSEK